MQRDSDLMMSDACERNVWDAMTPKEQMRYSDQSSRVVKHPGILRYIN